MSDAIKLLVADDHAMVRLGLEQVISRQSDIRLMASVGTGNEAIDAFGELSPDVALLDYRMPDMDGIEVAKEIVKVDPDAKLLIHSAYDGEETVWRAAKVGVRGYLTKSEDIKLILKAVRHVAKGGTYYPAELLEKIAARNERRALTNREREVLGLLAKGMSNKQIMDSLSISSATVRHHVSNVLEKLDADDRTDAVVKAAKRGIIHLD